jgi:hypothetical protein
MTLTLATTTGALTDLVTSVSIVDENGAIVAGPQDATWTSGHMTQTVTLGDTVTFPLGIHTYTVKGKIPSTTANGTGIQVKTTPSSGWSSPTGQTSGNTVTLPSGEVVMSTQTVKGATLTVSAAPTPVTQTIVAGGTGVTLGTLQLDASQSGEDIRVNSVPLDIVISNSNDYSELNTCQLYNGSTALNTGSNVPTLTANNTETAASSNKITISLDNSLIVSKGTVVTLAFKCNIVSSAEGGVKIGVYDNTNWAPTGVQSGVTVTGSSLSVTSQSYSGVQTYGGAGTFTAAIDTATTPARAYAAAGTTQVTASAIKVHATTESINLTKVGLSLNGSLCGLNSTGAGGTSNNCVNDIVQAVIYDGSTPVGTATFTGTTNTATSSLTTVVNVPANSDKVLTVKLDLASIGVSAAGGIGDLVKIAPTSAEAIGLSSGTTIKVTGTGTANGVQLVKSYPTVAFVSNATNPTGTNTTLKRFTVTANSAGPVSLYQMAFNVATSGASVYNLKLYAYTDAGYSQGVANQTSGTGQVGDAVCATQSSCIGNPIAIFNTGATPVQIPAGSTYYFALLGTVNGQGSNTSWTISPTLVGDSAALATGNTPGYIATTTAAIGSTVGANGAASVDDQAFIWSDNATTTPATTDVDWFNGFQVPGLPATGI